MSSHYLFEETRDPEVYQWTHLQMSVWRQNLSAEEFVQREHHLASTRICDVNRDDKQQHGIHFWVLRDLQLDSSTKTSNIVASCETLHRKSWKFVHNSEEMSRLDVLSPCIGAVHVLDQYRGRGLAKVLMQELTKQLDHMLHRDNFVTLYSEIGDFYLQYGFQHHYVPCVEFPVALPKDYQLPSKVSFVEFEQFDDLVSVYHGKFLKNIYESMGRDRERKTRVALVPTIDVVEWHHLRSNFVSRTLVGEEPGHFGVQLRDNQGFVLGFIVFTHDYLHKRLVLIMVHATELLHLQTLLSLVQYEASQIGYTGVTAWESDLFDYKVLVDPATKEKDDRELKEYIETELGGETGVKNGSISDVRMMDGDRDVVWHGNGKWLWF